MSPGIAHGAGATVGSLAAAGAAWAIGGWWWLAAAAAVIGAVGATADRQLVHLHALATLGLAGGAAVTGQRWLIVVLVVGFVATTETSAAADRVTVARPVVPDLDGLAPRVLGAGAIAAGVLLAGTLLPAPGALAGVAAALAAAATMRAIAR